MIKHTEGWKKRENILKKLKKEGTKEERYNKKRRMEQKKERVCAK
jgi:hypothetical protein